MNSRNIIILLTVLTLVTAAASAAVTGFTLVNADTDADIQIISNGDTINLAALASQNINIRANVDVAPTSVAMALTGATTRNQTESVAPYALWQDTAGDYAPGALNVGAHTLSATPSPGSVYTVNFTVVDNSGGQPTASAGVDKALMLPANSTTLTGSASDDGSISSYAWSQQSGPNTASLSGQSSATLNVSGLIAGTYVMRLSVTDNDSNTAYDEAQILVSSGPPPAPEGSFIEDNGLVVMEVESTPTIGGWDSRTEIAGYKGSAYYYNNGADSFGTPGKDTLSYEFTVTNAGNYQAQVRSRIAVGTNNTEHNDVWVRLVDTSGNPIAPIANDNQATGSWYKAYMNRANTWSYETSNKDNDAHSLSWSLSAGSTYKFQLSRRSNGHAVDRIVLWERGTHSFANATTGKSANDSAMNALPESERATTGTNIIYVGRTGFPNTNAGEVPYYEDTTRDCLAIDAANVSYRGKFARAERTFDGPSGLFDVTITTLTEEDGECTYRLFVNGAVVGTYQNPRVNASGDSQPNTHTWTGIMVNTGDTIAIESNTHSNGLIPEGAGYAWARGRWRQIEFASANGGRAAGIYGELKKWHKATIIFEGPETSETSATNPFLNYRLNVTFSHAGSGKSYVVPGYYAADGNAAETSAGSGNKWAVHFAPDEVGEWTYAASFRTGANVAVDASPTAGASAGFCDGATDSFTIAASDKTGRDHRGKGRLKYVGEHYLRFADSGEYFIKQGADSPENLLAYEDFDNTTDVGGRRKSWSPHAGDWNSGDPSWQSGKGTELIGAVNYLAGEGMNAMSFLTMSADGDDKNVFMWHGPTDYQRYDVSKCAQWEIVFEHMDKKGIYLHFKTQETENDKKLDGGALGTNRKLYYRELIARYGHHLALNWNLGEENVNTEQQRKDFAQFFYDHDPYGHNIVLHTYPGQQNGIYTPLLGTNSKLTGVSIQTNWNNVASETDTWVKQSAAAGKKWVVANDEQGSANDGIKPDSANDHDGRRKETLWGCLMSGGAGNEYYFGYAHAHSDLTCQDFRSRDLWWDYCRYAQQFFTTNNIPVQAMVNNNALSSNANDYCFYWENEVYVVYLRNGGTTTLNLSAATGSFEVKWFDPRNGGGLQNGSVTAVAGGGSVSLGAAPNASTQDWTILVRRAPGTTYNLNINGGTGGGSYSAGSVVGIVANAAPSGQMFDEWTGDTATVSDLGSASTTVTIPSANLTLSATYKTAVYYTLLVNNGSGDGSYTQGELVAITAAAPPNGQIFDAWIGDVSGVANVNSATTNLIMPASAAEITATYKDIPPVLLAINCGGNAFTAADGTDYAADQYVTGGSSYSTIDVISGTVDDALYQSERYGAFSYSVPIPNGTYNVLLQFAEIYNTFDGARVFDVLVEGGMVVDDLDIHSQVGHDATHDVLVTAVTVSDGVLSIAAVAVVGNPKLSAFRIMSSGPIDIDGDGIEDGWEISNFGNLTTATATSNYDGDGMSDLQEYLTHTDPDDRASFFGVTSFTPGVAINTLDLEWRGSTAAVYRIETCTDLSTWTTYADDINGAALNQHSIPLSGEKLFVRVVQK
jgi:hypothetical protein